MGRAPPGALSAAGAGGGGALRAVRCRRPWSGKTGGWARARGVVRGAGGWSPAHTARATPWQEDRGAPCRARARSAPPPGRGLPVARHSTPGAAGRSSWLGDGWVRGDGTKGPARYWAVTVRPGSTEQVRCSNAETRQTDGGTTVSVQDDTADAQRSRQPEAFGARPEGWSWHLLDEWRGNDVCIDKVWNAATERSLPGHAP